MGHIAICAADGTVYGIGPNVETAIVDAAASVDDTIDINRVDHLWVASFVNAHGWYYCPIAPHAVERVRAGYPHCHIVGDSRSTLRLA